MYIVVCILLCLVMIALCIKIYLMKKAAREIAQAFSERLQTDTNTLIDISSRDQSIRALAADINRQLVIFQQERHKFTQGNNELKTAVTNISHDLRTPLTAICGYLDLLRREEKSEKAQEYLAVIENRTEMLKQLTEELFKYSVILSADISDERQTVTVNDCLVESIAGYYGALMAVGITPEIHICEHKVVRTVSKSALSRVFANLLGNAVKYSGGDLLITLSEDGTITFSNSAADLDSLQTEKLFNRFYTVETARNSTGLGLSIAKMLVEQMDGKISANYSGGKLTIQIII